MDLYCEMRFNIMRQFLLGMLGTGVFIAIMYFPAPQNVKHLIIGILCLIIMIIYIMAIKRKTQSLGAKSLLILICPTVLLLLFIIANMNFEIIKIGLYVWVIYAFATAFAVRLAAVFLRE